ncbi:MAG: hypothetical protein GY854_03925 [Deltaproteobacteria bacterium]|nr:hypothetical protein [Deltaproteobacteria bacterium]
MMVGHTFRKVVPVCVAVIIAVIVAACPDNRGTGKLPSPPMMISRGIITASHNRYIETGSSSPFERFSLMGIFARYDVDRSATVESLLGNQPADIDLGLDRCTMPAQVLDEEVHLQESRLKTGIELLDVGDLTISFDKTARPVPTRTFPDLLKVIVGVIYTADETQEVLFRPGETYSLRASGTDEVAPFKVALDAPEDLGEIKVEGLTPGEQVPLIRRGEDIQLVWDGAEFGDEVVVSLSWISMGSPWSMTCRMRDDGQFVIPAIYTAGLPDPLTCEDEELTMTRVRQVAFRSDGMSSGSFRFVVSTNFPVTF